MTANRKNPADGKVIYQLFLRMFTPEGTLKSAEAHIEDLAHLGVDIIYLCPVARADEDTDRRFQSPRQLASGTGNPKNPYRIRDYYEIDPEYGADADLLSFVRACHRLGRKVMLDLVYFHCGPRAVFLTEHPDFVVRRDDDSAACGTYGFPRLNYENPALREYLWNNMTYFVETFDVDGYRCDMGDDIPLDFWREGARRCRALRPDFLMLNEGGRIDCFDVFDVNYWDSFGVYGAMEKALFGETDALPLAAALKMADEGVPDGKYALRLLDSHDIANNDSIDKKTRRERLYPEEAMNAAFAFILTARGVPMLYNGCEIADSGLHCIFANRFFGKEYGIDRTAAVEEKGKRRFTFLQKLIRLRHENAALAVGSETCVPNTAPEKVVSYLRAYGGERVLCAVSFAKEQTEASFFCGVGEIEPLFVHGASFAASDGKLTLRAEPYGFGVFRI